MATARQAQHGRAAGADARGPQVSLEDPEFAAGFSRLYNQWIADYCASSQGRLRGVAVTPGNIWVTCEPVEPILPGVIDVLGRFHHVCQRLPPLRG